MTAILIKLFSMLAVLLAMFYATENWQSTNRFFAGGFAALAALLVCHGVHLALGA